MITWIAEIGINHCGDLKLAKKMVLSSKLAGATIAKFQHYDPNILFAGNKLLIAQTRHVQLTIHEHLKLACFCEDLGIEYMCSVFHPHHVKLFEEIGVKRYKIASRSVFNNDLLYAINDTGKPVIVSNGMDRDLSAIKKIIRPLSRLTILECLPKYPTHQNDFKWKKLKFGPKRGLSSHCPSIIPSLFAISRGARMIEHHVKYPWQYRGLDMASSITFDQFTDMVKIGNQNEI